MINLQERKKTSDEIWTVQLGIYILGKMLGEQSFFNIFPIAGHPVIESVH